MAGNKYRLRVQVRFKFLIFKENTSFKDVLPGNRGVEQLKGSGTLSNVTAIHQIWISEHCWLESVRGRAVCSERVFS